MKMVQGGIWGDGVAEGLMRFEAGSGAGVIEGADGVADSLWVRFGILRGGLVMVDVEK